MNKLGNAQNSILYTVSSEGSDFGFGGLVSGAFCFGTSGFVS